MAERKSTPDILAEILAGDPSPLEGMPAEAPTVTQPKKVRSTAARPAAQPEPSPAPRPKLAASPAAARGWEYLVISFQEYRGWRARFRDGVELTDWTSGPLLHESLAQLAQDGWELVTATSGEPLYGAADKRQLYFRRRAS
jgi:hypothetical protein